MSFSMELTAERTKESAEALKLNHPKVTVAECNFTSAQFISNLGLTEDAARVLIIVGEEQKRYSLPKETICKRSEFLNAAFKYKKGQEQILNLEHIKVEHFEPCVQWMLTGDLFLPTKVFTEETCSDIWLRKMKFPRGTMTEGASLINKYIDILLVADELILNPSPATKITAEAEKFLWKYHCGTNRLTEDTFLKAYLLPSWNPFRRMLLFALVPHGLFYGFSMFAEQINSLEGFAKDLLWATFCYLRAAEPRGYWVLVREELSGLAKKYKFHDMAEFVNRLKHIDQIASEGTEKAGEFPRIPTDLLHTGWIPGFRPNGWDVKVAVSTEAVPSL